MPTKPLELVERSHAAYPAGLRDIAGAPSCLWVRGRLEPNHRAVAVVGSRAASSAGRAAAEQMGELLARAGVEVISGGALGIDAAAHRGALKGGGRTVAVLGTGADVVYPRRHAALFDQMVAAGGALVSQFPPGSGPLPGTFPTRNRVIAALAELVVVVEAAASSGALYTARAARSLGRRLAARPGSPGCDHLILAGAVALARPEDLLEVLAGRKPRLPELPADPAARRVYDALDEVARDVGELAARAGVPVGACAALMIDLELGGLCGRAAGGRYFRLGPIAGEWSALEVSRLR